MKSPALLSQPHRQIIIMAAIAGAHQGLHIPVEQILKAMPRLVPCLEQAAYVRTLIHCGMGAPEAACEALQGQAGAQAEALHNLLDALNKNKWRQFKNGSEKE